MEVWNPRVGEVTRLVVFEKWPAFFFFFLFLRRSLRDQKHQEAERRTFSLKDFLRSYRHNSFSVLLLSEPLKPSQRRSKVWVQAFFSLSR